MPRVVIVGGGISGLSTAYYLHKAGIETTIVEREARLGGVIKTDLIEGCVVELGPDSFLSAKRDARQLAEELGLGGDLIGSNDHQRATYIWRSGRLIRLPDGITMMVPGKLWPLMQSPILSLPGKVRAAYDLLRLPTHQQRDRSVAEFVTDHFGREVLDYIAEPMLGGVYGGDPERLSIGSVMPKFVGWEARYGSLIRAARAEIKPSREPIFTTLKGGLQSLVDAIVRVVRPRVIQGAVDRIEKGWRVHANGDWLECDHLVVACRAAAVLPDLFPAIPYNSARVIAVGYRRSELGISFDGFGFLVPRIERRDISALTWVPNKFNHRAPDDKVVVRCFTTGGKADVRSELKEKLGIAAEPLFEHEMEWPSSMPQYEVGHGDKVKIIEEMLGDFPGLHLVGNAYYGIGIPDCVRMGRQVADQVTLRTTSA